MINTFIGFSQRALAVDLDNLLSGRYMPHQLYRSFFDQKYASIICIITKYRVISALLSAIPPKFVFFARCRNKRPTSDSCQAIS